LQYKLALIMYVIRDMLGPERNNLQFDFWYETPQDMLNNTGNVEIPISRVLLAWNMINTHPTPTPIPTPPIFKIVHFVFSFAPADCQLSIYFLHNLVLLCKVQILCIRVSSF